MNRTITLCLSTIWLLAIANFAYGQQPIWSFFSHTGAPLSQLAIDHSGMLWGVSSTGVDEFDGTTWHDYAVPDGLPSDTCNSLCVAPNGSIWVATRRGLASFDGTAWHSVTINDSLEALRNFIAIACDSNGTIWTSSESYILNYFVGSIPIYRVISQIHHFNNGAWQTYDISAQAGTPSAPFFLGVDHTGQVWGASLQTYDSASSIYQGGLWNFNGGTWSQLTYGGNTEYNNTKQPTGLLCESDSSIWVSFFGYYNTSENPGSLNRFDGTTWTSFGAANGLSSLGGVFFIAQDIASRIWIGDPGLSYFRDTVVKEYNMSNSPMQENIPASVAFASDGSMWVSCTEGLYHVVNALSKVSDVVAVCLSPLSYPNPVRTSSTIAYTLSNDASVKILLYNSVGVCVSTLANETQEAGSHMLGIDFSQFPEGSYRAEIRATEVDGSISLQSVALSILR